MTIAACSLFYVLAFTGNSLLYCYFGRCRSNNIMMMRLLGIIAVTSLQLSGYKGSLQTLLVISLYAVYLGYSAVSKNPHGACNPCLGSKGDPYGIVVGRQDGEPCLDGLALDRRGPAEFDWGCCKGAVLKEECKWLMALQGAGRGAQPWQSVSQILGQWPAAVETCALLRRQLLRRGGRGRPPPALYQGLESESRTGIGQLLGGHVTQHVQGGGDIIPHRGKSTGGKGEHGHDHDHDQSVGRVVIVRVDPHGAAWNWWCYCTQPGWFVVSHPPTTVHQKILTSVWKGFLPNWLLQISEHELAHDINIHPVPSDRSC